MKRQLVWGGALTAGGRCARLVSELGVVGEIGAGEESRMGGRWGKRKGVGIGGVDSGETLDTSSTLATSLLLSETWAKQLPRSI